MSYIEVDNVSYTYPNGFLAVENLSLSIDKGENIAIIGQNGAGKTTTVKMMNRLLKPTSGNIIIDGMNTKDYTAAQISKKVGYVFQNPDDQIFHSDIYSEIKFGPKKLGYPEEKVKENVHAAAKLTDVEKYLEEHPYNLPYSLRKFVTIACILAMDTDVIIFDEPTAGQDFAGVKKISYIINELIKQNKTIITITHDMEFVVENFERVIVMAGKKKVADKNKREVFWDFEVIEKAKIKQPHISRLAKKLHVSNTILNSEEMIEHLEEERTAQR